jgi:hypothetical protein
VDGLNQSGCRSEEFFPLKREKIEKGVNMLLLKGGSNA